MNFQFVIVILTFAAAVFWLGRMAYNNFRKKDDAASCDKCK